MDSGINGGKANLVDRRDRSEMKAKRGKTEWRLTTTKRQRKNPTRRDES